MQLDPATIAAIGAAGTGGLATIGAGYWFRRWASKTDDKLEALAKAVQDLNVAVQVAAAKRSEHKGSMRTIQEQVSEIQRSMGRHEGSLHKLWDFLLKKFNGELRRLSDPGGDT